MQIHELGIYELSGLLKNREISCVDAVNAYIDRIHDKDRNINSYIYHDFEQAQKKALEFDKQSRSNDIPSTLAGIPFAVKDNMCIKDTPTTCASRMLSGFVAPYTATAVSKLNAAGAICLGKLNMDEFAMGSSNETSFFGTVRNPHDPEKVPGGSSGGSAAAVAAGLACFTLGSDTGGSIRQPASFCGVVGLKPTYGRVSRYGLVAFASSLDQIGPISRNVRDAAIVLECISGSDRMDQTSADEAAAFTGFSDKQDISGMRIALPTEYFGEGLDPEVKNIINESAKKLVQMGAIVEEISLPLTDYAIPAYYIISSAEASSNLARYDGIKYGYRADHFNDLTDIYVSSRSEAFGREVKRRIMIGTYVLSSGYYDAYYLKAQKVRENIRGYMINVFSKYDAIIGPVAPSTAYGIGEKTGDPLKMYLEDVYTVSANIAGIPAISVPAGKDSNGLPVGLQIMCGHFEEQKMIRIADAFLNYQTKEYGD